MDNGRISYLRWLVYAATTRVQVAAVWTLSSHHHYSNHSAQWESVLVVGGQQFAQIGNYYLEKLFVNMSLKTQSI